MFTPAPKPTRVKDKEVLKYVVFERDGTCLYGLTTGEKCSTGLDPHHIHSKGAGGGDTKENLITLCREHHNAAQENRISASRLRHILRGLYGYSYSDYEMEE